MMKFEPKTTISRYIMTVTGLMELVSFLRLRCEPVPSACPHWCHLSDGGVVALMHVQLVDRARRGNIKVGRLCEAKPVSALYKANLFAIKPVTYLPIL